tara:strand:- start:578 stop:793 length:216 start_codon:yes stop_codon:yes gene_type:complete
MDEKTQKDIITILMKENRPDLVAILITLFEEIDSDFEFEEQDEPYEEFMEGGSVEEDTTYDITKDGFYFLK